MNAALSAYGPRGPRIPESLHLVVIVSAPTRQSKLKHKSGAEADKSRSRLGFASDVNGSEIPDLLQGLELSTLRLR